jgi:N-acetylmuramoyl-L-alanine amidase
MRGSSLKIAEYPAHKNNYTVGRQGSSIKEITIHHMAGRLTARVCASIFQNPNRRASSHYGIGYDGEIAQYVDEDNTSYCNSNWESNKRAITIETANSKNGEPWEVSDASISSLIKLVADIAKRNNIGTLVKGKNLTWHSMYANTNCPGQYLFSKFEYIINEANKLIDGVKPASIEVFPGIADEELARRVWLGEFGNGEERKAKLGNRYDSVQNLVNQGIGKPTTSPLPPQQNNDEDLLLLVKKTIRGDFGNGQARKNLLGSQYEEVQRQVNANINAGLTRWDNIRLF